MLKIRVGWVKKFNAPFIIPWMLFPRVLWFVKHQSGLSLKEVVMLISSTAENVEVSMVNLILEGKTCYIIETLQKSSVPHREGKG